MEESAFVRKKFMYKMMVAPVIQTLDVIVFTMLPISLGLIIFNTTPFFVAILGYFVNKEKLTGTDLFGIIFSFIGVCMLVYQDES